MLITALGSWVLLGWTLRNPAWLQIRPEYVAMVVNTALCFLLLGMAFLLPLIKFGQKTALQSLIGWIVIGIAGLVLLEIVLDIDLGIDGYEVHAWLADNNPRPGRMAPNTAIGFLLAGATLVISQKVSHKIAVWQYRSAHSAYCWWD